MNMGLDVSVVDSLASGTRSNIGGWLSSPRFKFFKTDIQKMNDTTPMKDCEIVFHLAANPEVRDGFNSPSLEFNRNVVTTRTLLETMRKTRSCQKIVYTSSSTVYGEPMIVPTPESYGPLEPISVYGATKLACEALVSAYCHSYGLESVIFRLANVVGQRANHGVIPDFISKISQNSNELQILGDGTQRKSYIHVKDCTAALLLGLKRLESRVSILNVGSRDTLDVVSIAKIVAGALHREGIHLKVSGGVDGGRGWYGDVKTMLLDTSRIERLGWKPTMNSAESIKAATEEMLEKPVAMS